MPTNPKRMSAEELASFRKAPWAWTYSLYAHIDALQAEIDALQEFKADRTALVLKYEEAQREIVSLQQQLDHITRECPGVICSKHTAPKYVLEMAKEIERLSPKPEPSKADATAELIQRAASYLTLHWATWARIAANLEREPERIEIIDDLVKSNEDTPEQREKVQRWHEEFAGAAQKPERIEVTEAMIKRAAEALEKYASYLGGVSLLSVRVALEAALNPEGKP